MKTNSLDSSRDGPKRREFRISEERYEVRERNSASAIENRAETSTASYLLKRSNTYHDDESPSYSSRNRSSRESSVSSRASFSNATSSSSGNRNVSSSTGINNYHDTESHNTNSIAAHEPVANASSSHHGTSSVSYQNLPGASSTQDNLSTSTSSSHSNDREELKTSAICIRDLPSRSTESNLKEGLYHDFKKYGRIKAINFHEQGSSRHATVIYAKADGAERALSDCKDKLFFGTRIEVNPACKSLELEEPITVRSPTITNSRSETELDEFHPRATRTLFVGNLDKDISKTELTNKFSQFGEILEIDIKSQSHSPYAFIQYTDISSVVKAMRKYDGDTMVGQKLKCGFGKSFPSCCVWLCDNKDDAKERAFADEKLIISNMKRYGNVKHSSFSRDQKSALIFYENSDEARKAVDELHNKLVNGRKVQVDFASRDFQNFFITKNKISEESHRRSTSSGWTNSNNSGSSMSLDYEERSYENSRSRSMYHHYQTPSRSSSSSLSSGLLRSNSGNNASYSSRQRSPSPAPSPANMNFSSFSRSSSVKSSKYDYHHDSLSSRSSRQYATRYEGDDLDDPGEDSHLSSSSKRESSSSSRYRPHHLSDNYLSESSPKVRRDSSPYGSYESSRKAEVQSEFRRSDRERSSNIEEPKLHDDLHRRANHKSYHKSRESSPHLPSSVHSSTAQLRKSGLASSSSSTSSSSRSPARESTVKSSTYYNPERTSISPATSPARNSGHLFHDGDSQSDVLANKPDKDYNSLSSWRRKSTEDSSHYREHSSSDPSRVRSESISEPNDCAFSNSNSREHSCGSDYYRSRAESTLHRTNSSPSSNSTSLPYQNRNESLKRKHSNLESDDDSHGTVQERKKRLMACLDSSNAANNAVVGAIPTTPVKGTPTTREQLRTAQSKSVDSTAGLNSSKQQALQSSVKPLRDGIPSSLDLKRRSSSSSSSSSVALGPANNLGGNGSNLDLKPNQFNDMLNNLRNQIIHGNAEPERLKSLSLILNTTSIFPNATSTVLEAKSTTIPSPVMGRKPSLTGAECSTPLSAKPSALTKESSNLVQLLRTVNVLDCNLLSHQPDPRVSGLGARRFSSSSSCDNDLSKHKSLDSSSSLSSFSPYGPTIPMILRLPEFAIEYIFRNSTDSKSLSTSASVTTYASSSTLSLSVTTTASTVTPSAPLPHINIPTTFTTSPASANIMSPLGSHSPVPKSRLSRDRLSTETNSIDSKKPSDLDDVSDSEISPLRTSSIDDQIRALDDKLNAWSGTTSVVSSLRLEKTPTIDYSKYNIKKKSQASSGISTNAAHLGSTAECDSDLFRNILTKTSSAFDQDTKRLEHVSVDKYESRKDLEMESILSSKPKVNSALLRTKSLNSSVNSKEPAPLLSTLNSLAHSSSTVPTEKPAVGSLSKGTPTSTTSAASVQHNTNSLSTTTPHFNHQHHSSSHHHSFSSSNATPTSSSSMSRKLSDASRVSSLKKDASLVPTSAPTPSTPCSAPVRSASSSMFPQFHRSSSIPTTTIAGTPSTPSTTSSLARSNFAPNKKEGVFPTSSASSTLTSAKSDKNKAELSTTKGLSMNDRKDSIVNKKESITGPAPLSNQSKPDLATAVRKDSIPKHITTPKNEFFKSSRPDGTKAEIPASRKEHKHSEHSDHSANCLDELQQQPSRDKSNSDISKHSNKERDDYKEHKKLEKDNQHKAEKHRDKSSDGNFSMSNHGNSHFNKEKEKLKMDKMEKSFLKEKREKEERKKNKEKFREKEQKDKDSLGGCLGSKEKDQKEQARHKAKMQERAEKKAMEGKDREKNKDKEKNMDKDKNKEKHKVKSSKENNKETRLTDAEIKALLEIPDIDEPIYFSMYDKVKARSAASNKGVTKEPDSGRQKMNQWNQLKDKRQHRKIESSSSSDSSSDSDVESQQAKKANLLKKRKFIQSSDSSSDEEITKSRPKKTNFVKDSDSESETEKAVKEKEEKRKVKAAAERKKQAEQSMMSNLSDESNDFHGRKGTKYAKKILELTDDSSSNEAKKGERKRKKLKREKEREKERPNDIGSLVKVEKHDPMYEKLKEQARKKKAERKEAKRAEEKERRMKAAREIFGDDSEIDEKPDISTDRTFAKKKKKKTKSSSKEKRHLSAKEGKLHSADQSRKMSKVLSSDDDMSFSSDAEDAAISSGNIAPHNTLSDSDSETRTHVIKCFSKDKQAKGDMHLHHHYHHHSDKEKVDIKVNHLHEKPDKAERSGDRSPVKKNVSLFSSKNSVSNFIKSEDEEDSSMREIVKKKRSNKSKDKCRKDSESSDSKKNERREKEPSAFAMSELMLDCKSHDSDDLLSLTSPPQPFTTSKPKTDFNSIILPGLATPSKGPTTPSPPPKTPDVLSSRSSSYTDNIILERDDGSSSDSRLDEELMNDARKLEECMMQKNDDSYDSNLSGSNSPLNSTSKTLHQTDLTNLLPNLVVPPSVFSAENSLDSKAFSNVLYPQQRCFDDEATIQSRKLQKELESKESDLLHKPAFETLPPFPRFSSAVEKTAIEESVFTSVEASLPSKVPEDPTLFIPVEIESSKPTQEETVKVIDFNDMESQRNIEDDLAVAALLQDMNDPIHVEPGTHERSTIDQNHAEKMPNFLNILIPRTSTENDHRPELQLTTPSAQTIVTNTIVPSSITAPEICIDDQELNAAVQEIELASVPSPPPPAEHKEPARKSEAEMMFNDEDDDDHQLIIVDETALDKTLLGDSSDPRPPLATASSKKPVIGPLGLVPFGSFEPSICLPKPPPLTSIADILKDCTRKDNAKLPEMAKPIEPKVETPKLDRSEHPRIDLHASMPILTSAFDPKKQAEMAASIKERTRSHEEIIHDQERRSDSDKLVLFASFRSPQSISSDSMPSDKKTVIDQLLSESFVVDDKRDSCSESVVSDKTEIEEESTTEMLFRESDNLPTVDKVPTCASDEMTPHCEAKNNLSKLSEESEPESENIVAKGKRGRKPKNRKSSDSSMHSPRSEASLDQHCPMGSLSINTNFTSTGNQLLSPTSNSNASSTTTTSDISPGSQTKRGGKQQQQHTFSYAIRRSVRNAAVIATVANSSTALELEDTDFSQDEPSFNNKDEQAEEEQGVKKVGKRGRKKKVSGNVEHVVTVKEDFQDNKIKKEVRHAISFGGTDSSSSKLYDVFEFREDDDEEPITMGSSHFMSSATDEKRHPEATEEARITTAFLEPKIEVPTAGPAPSLPLTEATVPVVSSAISPVAPVVLGVSSTAPSGKEYVTEMGQHGKLSLIIRAKDGQEGTVPEVVKPTKSTVVIEDSKSNDAVSNLPATNSEGPNSAKGVRKSARLMSLVPKTTIEDTIEDVVKSKDAEKALKRITRSYRKSDDSTTTQTPGESLDESDDSKNASRPVRVTRSRGVPNADSDNATSSEVVPTLAPSRLASPPITSPPPRTPKKSTDYSVEHVEALPLTTIQSTPTLIEVPHNVNSVLEEEQHSKQEPETDNEQREPSLKIAISPSAVSVAGESTKIESPSSVIQSTGNVEKMITIGTTMPVNSVITSTIPLSSASVITTSASVITATPAQPAQGSFTSPVITSPTYLQDIPNISERIHHSSTALKLKTGKGYFFEAQPPAPISAASSSPIESAQMQISFTPVTPLTPVIIPSTSASSKVNEGPAAVSSLVPPASISGGQPIITLKPKYQPPVGQPLSQATTDLWSGVSSISKPFISPVITVGAQVPTTVVTTTTIPESSIDRAIVQPPLVHIPKPTPSVTLSVINENVNSGTSMPTSVVTSHQSVPVPDIPASKTSSVPADILPVNNKAVPANKPVVQVSGAQPPVPMVPPELAVHLAAFPPHLVANQHSQLEYLQSQQQYMNNLQKQQQQQQQPMHQSQQAPPGTRNLKPTEQPAPGFDSPSAPHFSASDLQQASALLGPQFTGLPHMRTPVSSASGQSVLLPRPFLPTEMDLLAHQHMMSMYSDPMRNGPAAIRPSLGLPRFMYPGLPLPTGLTPEGIAELLKNHQQATLQAEMSKQEAEQLGKQQQNGNGAKKEEMHRASMGEHHNEAAFHLEAPMPLPPAGQRNVPFSPNMRPFPPYTMPGAPQERWTSAEAALMHSMYGMQLNTQGRGLPVPAHTFPGAVSAAPTDLSKQQAVQSQPPTPEPLKRSSAPKAATTQDAAYLAQMTRQLPSPSAHSPAFRKELPAVQEPTADMIRSQMASLGPAAGALPLNMAAQLNQRPTSQPPSNLQVQGAHSLGRPPLEPSVVEQANAIANRTTTIHNSINLALRNQEQHTAHSTSPNAIPAHIDPPRNVEVATQPNASNAPGTIQERYPVLWNGILALKNDQACVQMHFLSGNRDISSRALPPFAEMNAQPLRITQRMRIEYSQLSALERKIQSRDEYCILLAVPSGKDNTEVELSSHQLRQFFINYLSSKMAAGIVNTNDNACSYITHIFPDCEFAMKHVLAHGPDLVQSLRGFPYLTVIITTSN